MSLKIQIHPAAEIAPPLEGAAMDALCDLLKRYGDIDQLDPILGVRIPEADGTLNGSVQILSGRSKLAACEKLGIEPRIHLYEPKNGGGESLAELAASITILRRHLSASQRAAAGVTIEEQFAAEAKNLQKAAGGDRKSLLINLSKAISIKKLPNVEAYLRQLPVCELADIHRKLFKKNLGENLSTNVMFADVYSAILKHQKEMSDPVEAVELHARKRAAQICDVSEAYIGKAKIVAHTDPKLFLQLMRGETSLGQACSEVNRRIKRISLNVSGPFEKPTDNKGLDGIRDGDCNKILPTLPRRRVRLAIVDPAYNIGIDYGNGKSSDKLPDAEYLGIHERWIKQMPDLLTPDGAVWVIINNEYAAEFVMMLKRAGLHMRGWIKWYETFGTNCSNNFNRTSRHLLYFVRDPKRFVFNAEPIRRLSARALVYKDKRKSVDGMKIWDDVWDIPRLNGTGNERIPDVPTQLPEALIRPIVEACSDEGDLVLDPMCGSGTTPTVCKRVGRQCLGIEFNPEFARIARARVASVKGPLR